MTYNTVITVMTGTILNRCCQKLISVLLCTFVYWGKLSCIGEYFSVFTIPIRKKINLLFVQSNIFKSRSDMCRCNDLLILTLGFTEPTQNTSTVYIMMHILNKADSVIWIHANITGSNIYIHFICFQVDFVPGHSIILQIYCHQIVKISNEPNNQYTRGQSDKCSTLRECSESDLLLYWTPLSLGSGESQLWRSHHVSRGVVLASKFKIDFMRSEDWIGLYWSYTWIFNVISWAPSQNTGQASIGFTWEYMYKLYIYVYWTIY